MSAMLKKLLPVLMVSAMPLATLQAQQLLGISQSNYAGTNGIYANPSSIADSRHGFYFNFFTFDAHASNNYFRYNLPYPLYKWGQNNPNSDEGFVLEDKYVEERLNGKPKLFSAGLDFRGPSFMLKMSPKHSFAVSTRSRTFIQGNNISEDLARMIRQGFDESDLQNIPYRNQQFAMNVNSVAEVGLTYARTIWEQDKNFLKGGFTVKRLAGMYSAHVISRDLSFTVKEDAEENSYLDVQSLDLAAGYSRSEFELDDQEIIDALRLRKTPGSGWGLDLGFTYERRPDIDEYRYTMDGKDKLDNRKNKYKYRVAVALMDIGGVRYRDPRHVNAYDVRRTNIRLDGEELETSGGEDLAQILDEMLDVRPSERSNTLRSGLPTALNLNIDYHIYGKLYVNTALIHGLRGRNAIAMRHNSMLAVTPRLEMKWLELSFPVSLQNNYGDFALGTMLRLGPLFVGSDNVGGVLGISKIMGADVYAGLSLPIMKGKKKDRDNDGVSNRKDLCKNVPGVWAFKGCPDSDGDGVQDSEDHCPAEPGLAQFNGCPDTDGDGIKDSEDACPEVAGLPQFGGCPDSDGDGVQDSEDKCPNEAGLAQFNGCPDRDGDGIPDKEDRCPDVKGLTQFKGCPDTDGDGVADPDDACPNQKGSAALKGCPDRDGDEIADKDDKCPDEYGTKRNNGCPEVKVEEKVVEKIVYLELTKEEQKVLKEAFDALEFETGKAVIAAGSFSSLDELAELLIVKKEYRLLVSGHTDNVGKPASNLKLSKDRADAVKRYLVGQGVLSDKIITEGFGSAKPIADNKTPAGRQKNRRVEMKVIK
jgi:outer membrane protein OmpA-like peptidoglycan-associated protein